MGEPEDDGDGRQKAPDIWTYGVNDLVDENIVAEEAKRFAPTGKLRPDFLALCRRCGLSPHSAFLPPKGAAEASALIVQASLLDAATLRVLRHVLPAASELRSLKLSGCRLDVQQLGLLKQGIAEECTVSTLHIDWNQLDLPHEDPAEVRRLGTEGHEEELDELERRRCRRQAARELRHLGARMATLFGELPLAILALGEAILRHATSQSTAPRGAAGALGVASQVALAVKATPSARASISLEPLDIATWTMCCTESLRLSSEEAENLFALLDGPDFGSGDGLVPLSKAQAVIEGCSVEGAEEGTDPSGAAFAGFLDAASPLEVVSFRYCAIGLPEVQPLARALALPSPHLKALNLWGNRICDRGAEVLALALQTNFGLQFLGLGRNLITTQGLKHLCRPLGVTVILEKAEADSVSKGIKEQNADKAKKLKGAPPPKKDASGRERYTPELYVPVCEEFKMPETNQPYWLWTRNLVLRSLVLEGNPIADATAVRSLLPFGCGDLVLKGTPCADALLAAGFGGGDGSGGGGWAGRQKEAVGSPPAAAAGSPAASPTGGATAGFPSDAGAGGVDVEDASAALPPFLGAAAAVKGWRVVLS